jgi:signal transduction histidine kinase
VCQELALSFKATIDYKGPAALPRVRMSPTELTQVLINVLANGTQAVGRRGGAHGRVTISTAIDGAMLEFKVTDNGAGMTKDVLARVGTPFFTTREEGTGLGIAQCQRLVGSVGGRWRIDSELGVGTTVMFLLPIAA